MNRDQLHDALAQLVEHDEAPTSEQSRTFRNKAARRRMLHRGVVVGVVCVIVLAVGGAAALADRDSSSPRVVTPADSTPTSLAPAEPLTVTAIGDTVMFGAVDPLVAAIDARLGNPAAEHLTTVNAVEDRQFSGGVDAIQQAKDAGTLGQVVIVHLGTNGTVDPGDVDRMMGLLADRDQVVIVNAKVPRPWEQQVNDTLAAAVKSSTNVVLLDWHAYGLAHPELFYDDGIHLRPEGAQAYADFLASALRTGKADEQARSAPSSTTLAPPDVSDSDASVIPTGQYRYVKVTGTWTGTFLYASDASYTVLIPRTYEFWIGTDDSGRRRDDDGEPTFLSPENEQAFNAAGLTGPAAVPEHNDRAFGPGDMHSLDLATLPVEEDALRDALNAMAHTEPSAAFYPERLLEALSDNLWLMYGPTRNSRALLHVLSSTPGMNVRTADDMTIVSADKGDGVRKEIWFDSATGQIRRKRQVIIDATIPYALRAPNGTVLEDATLEVATLVPSTDAAPEPPIGQGRP